MDLKTRQLVRYSLGPENPTIAFPCTDENTDFPDFASCVLRSSGSSDQSIDLQIETCTIAAMVLSKVEGNASCSLIAIRQKFAKVQVKVFFEFWNAL